MLAPERKGKWWLLLLATLLMLTCAVLFIGELRRGSMGIDLMEFVALKLTIPMGLSLVLLFFYLNKPNKSEE
jgi:hypothetical protein